MSAPQGLIEFAGIQNPISAQFTLTHGVSPSSATIVCAPQSGRVWKVGPMVISYGGTRITFHGCTVDRIGVEYEGDGTETWLVHILDRRWKWKECGKISGYYNVRRGTDEIIKETEKTPRELAVLCLKAMGETKYDVSALPELPRPEIEWDYTRPAEALAQVCDDYGCRVVLQLDNTIKIVTAGVGNNLVIDNLATAGSGEPDPPERPDELVFVAGKTRWQFDFILEAVGLDLDENDDFVVRPINKLSYIPIWTSSQGARRKTWDYVDVSHFYAVSKARKFRQMAKSSVFRWYRIKTGFLLPDVKERINDLDHILPIEEVQIEKMKIEGREEPRPAWIFGLFNPDLDSKQDADTESVYPDHNVLGKPRSLFHGDFKIDTATGIVKFAKPMFRYKDVSPTDSRIIPANLRLRTTVSLRDPKTRAWLRKEIKRKLQGPRAGTRPRYVTRDDVAEEFYHVYSKGKPKKHDNKKFLEKQAKYYLDAAEAEYQFTAPSSVSYAGFRPINPDGAIQQVTWSTADGWATTRASRNKEELLILPTYKERRRMERLREALQKERATERQKGEKQRKGRA